MSTTSLDRGRMIPIHPGRRAASDADRGPRPLAAATRKVLPSFIAGGGGGLSGYCASSPRWRISGQ